MSLQCKICNYATMDCKITTCPRCSGMLTFSGCGTCSSCSPGSMFYINSTISDTSTISKNRLFKFLKHSLSK